MDFRLVHNTSSCTLSHGDKDNSMLLQLFVEQRSQNFSALTDDFNALKEMGLRLQKSHEGKFTDLTQKFLWADKFYANSLPRVS